MKFSILIPIYYKEKVEYFNRAMLSIWDEQTIKPDEIVLVEDGPLTESLYKEINKWKEKLNNVLKIVNIEKNSGLGIALKIGLLECSNNLVARMDSDDISMPNRFEKQLAIMKNAEIDVCSSWISEFDKKENNIISYRKLPENHNDIIKYAKYRNPINHPVVMFRKPSVLKVGNYEKMIFFEDYYLWIRMIKSGYKFYNIQEVLLNMRSGSSILPRRRGYKYALYEQNFYKAIYRMNIYSNIFEYIFISRSRFLLRVLPEKILKNIYIIIRKLNKY